MLLEITANAGQKIGTSIDFTSDTNHITLKAAQRLNIRSAETRLVHGWRDEDTSAYEAISSTYQNEVLWIQLHTPSNDLLWT